MQLPPADPALLATTSSTSVIVLGAPRSGTSMLASLFDRTALFMGTELLPATAANPKGYFEDRGINDLNNAIIRQMLEWNRLNRIRRAICHAVDLDRRAWAHVAPRRPRRPALPDQLKRRIAEYTERAPFCFKDPRFCNTLWAWLPYLPEPTHCLVVFRQPDRTIESMVRNANEVYDPPTPVDRHWAETCWRRLYGRLLRRHAGRSEWTFLHYDQVARGDGVARIRAVTGHQVGEDSIDPAIRRTGKEKADLTVRSDTQRLYIKLCRAAGWSPGA